MFGSLGCVGYIGYLAADIFKESWLFPIALTFLGGGVVYLGVLWQKNEKKITLKTRKMLPNALRELLASKAND